MDHRSISNEGQAVALMIFRRDLRIDDNTALNAAINSGCPVLPVFILDPRQIEPHPYRSEFGLRFLGQALVSLSESFERLGAKLYILFGVAEDVIQQLIADLSISSIHFNRDYTPFSENRDRAIYEIGKKRGVPVHRYKDALLFEPEEGLKRDGTPYSVFTPFYKAAALKSVSAPKKIFTANQAAHTFATLDQQQLVNLQASPELLQRLLTYGSSSAFADGSSRSAKQALGEATSLTDYKDNRDFPARAATSGLSAHLKFGTLSVRQVWHSFADSFGPESAIVRQLYWRDFFHHIAHNFPHIFTGAFHTIYDKLEWNEPTEGFSRWCNGETGFPIVDAGMRQLNQTGFMHNRVRMITASFLTKDLHISWREGERYFATKLVDYDPCVNNGSWQWSASTGCDAQPYFRIFNPWLQQQKFDPEGSYIKQWLPELAALPAKALHRLNDPEFPRPKSYPPPMVDHLVEKLIAEERFSALKAK